MRQLVIAIVVLIGLGFSAASILMARTDQETRLLQAVRNAITDYIRPKTESFARSSMMLKGASEKLCIAPSAEALVAAQRQFKTTLLDFAAIEFLRIGPTETSDRRARLWHWPDRRSLGLRQVQRVLANKDTTVLELERLQQKSVALQGLGTLEFLLFGSGSEYLVIPKEEFRCGFVESVAGNISMIAEQIREDWSSSDGFVRSWLNPSPQNELFRSNKEALTGLVGMLSVSFEAIADQRLGLIAPGNGNPRNFKRAFFWRSEMTIPMLKTSIDSLQEIIGVTKLLELVPSEAGVAGNVQFEFNAIRRTLVDINMPVEELIANDEHAQKLGYLTVVMRSLKDIIGTDYSLALGLPTKFSSLDGD